MDGLESPQVFEFGAFRLDYRAGVLFRIDHAGNFVPLTVGSRVLDILHLLVRNQGEVVSKRTILAQVWPHVVVEESNLTTQISVLRRTIDEGQPERSWIQTVPGRGYRFVGQVRRVQTASTPGQTEPSEAPVSSPEPPPFPSPVSRQPPPREPSLRRTLLLVNAVFAVLLLGLIGWFGMSWIRPPRSVPPRLSIAVLPFRNIGADAADNYLAEGVTEDLQSDLSHLPDATVVALAASGQYRNENIAPSEIGRQLNVRYMIRGTVRRLDDMLRVNVQLIATESGATLWSDRFDQWPAAGMAAEEQMVARMRSGLGVSLVDVETVRSLRERPGNPDAADLVLRARWLLNQPYNEARSAEALALFERTLTIDPDSVQALTGIAAIHIDKAMDQTRWLDANALARSEELLERARRIAPNSERVLAVSAAMLRSKDRCDQLTEAAEALIRRFPNLIAGYNFLGWCKLFNGHPEEELPLLRHVMTIDPVGSKAADWYQRLAQDYTLLGRSAEAIDMIKRAMAANPDMQSGQLSNAYIQLAIAHARLGDLEEARHWLDQCGKLRPLDTVRRYHFHGSTNQVLEAQMSSVRETLRRIGLRDHAEEGVDIGLPPAHDLQKTLEGVTPAAVVGATTIRTADLQQLLVEEMPLVVDTGYYPTGQSLPTAIELRFSGLAGSLDDKMQLRLAHVMAKLTHNDLNAAIVVVGWNAERFDGPNLAVRLTNLGYRNVWWYRGGREAWEVNGLPLVEPLHMDW
jgi:adenylate cyclase